MTGSQHTPQELEMLKGDAEGRAQTDCMIHRLHDPSLTVEVHHFHMVSQELDRVEEVLIDMEDQWGELATMKLKTIRRLEMADVLQRMQDSVVTAQANIFAILGNKIVKNLKVFVEVDYLRSRGVLCQP